MKFKAILLMALALASCSIDRSDNGNIQSPRLEARSATLASEAPTADDTVLSIWWTEPEGSAITLQMAPLASFTGQVYAQKMAAGVTALELTYAELNDIMLSALGMEAGLTAPLYIRVYAELGELVAYSDVATVTVTPGAAIDSPLLTCSTTEVKLTESTPDRLALSLSWTKNGAGVTNSIELCYDDAFLLPYSQKVPEGVHDRQYTYGELNDILCDSLGFAPDTEAYLFARIVSSFETAANSSNIVRISVIPRASTPSTPDDGPKVLYVSGASPADPWNFDDYLIQYNSTSASYCGTIMVDTQWGYKFYPEKDNWNYCYTRSSGDALNGYLMLGNANSPNMYKPDPGMYFFNVSLGNYTYSLAQVKTVSYTGFNDSWNLTRMTQSSENPLVFTAKVTVTKKNPYRWQIVFNDDWSLKLCAVDGYLLYDNEGNSTEDIPNGTYTLTVDLAKGTYTLEK